jgi:hypothetical protein
MTISGFADNNNKKKMNADRQLPMKKVRVGG